MKRKISIILSVFLFILFLILYLTNNINIFDEFFYNIIIKLKSNSFTKFVLLITSLASTKFIIILMIIFLCIFFITKKKIYLITDILIIGEVIINNVLKLIVGRERPELIKLVTETSYSFPSGHTMVAVVLYGFIIYLVNKSNINNILKKLITSILIMLIILIMMSRIYLGVHFASDVFAGMCLSIAYLLIVINLLERRKLL